MKTVSAKYTQDCKLSSYIHCDNLSPLKTVQGVGLL